MFVNGRILVVINHHNISIDEIEDNAKNISIDEIEDNAKKQLQRKVKHAKQT